MDRDQIVSTLRDHTADLQRLGAATLYLFGSAARNEAGSSSDVDLLFEFTDPAFIVLELIALKERISKLVQRPTDIMSRRNIHPILSRARPSGCSSGMRDARIRLEDISEAIAGIEQTLAGVDLVQFSESWQMQRAVDVAWKLSQRRAEECTTKKLLMSRYPGVRSSAIEDPASRIPSRGTGHHLEYHKIPPPCPILGG